MLLLQTGPHCGASAARKVLQEPQQEAAQNEPVMPRLSRFHKHASEADMEELLE